MEGAHQPGLLVRGPRGGAGAYPGQPERGISEPTGTDADREAAKVIALPGFQPCSHKFCQALAGCGAANGSRGCLLVSAREPAHRRRERPPERGRQGNLADPPKSGAHGERPRVIADRFRRRVWHSRPGLGPTADDDDRCRM